ncbi:hypothetical protein TNIN_234101 [Trichonephila inaurata madagascariensis]|uniref:Uncharacterized protein n=1 Tax=Trichonephila inaurata madagascariensis TaxID=2747483 RepID=A0A8X6J2K5_9ARAC|nr:hypothetical protein TNIN_234101 [Trichonephila inaurata madagascariensis]
MHFAGQRYGEDLTNILQIALFCMTSTVDLSSKSNSTIQYPNISWAPKTHYLQLETNLEEFESLPEPSMSTEDNEEYPYDLVL